MLGVRTRWAISIPANDGDPTRCIGLDPMLPEEPCTGPIRWRGRLTVNPVRRFCACSPHSRHLQAREPILPVPAPPRRLEIAAGMGYAVNETLPELADQQHPAGRSLHETWIAGDRDVVGHWLATVEEREAAEDERRRTDPELVRLRELRAIDRWPDLAERFATRA